MQAIPGLPSLSVSLLSRGLVSCLLGKVTDILSSSGLALSRVRDLCVGKRGDVEQRFIVGSCSTPAPFLGSLQGLLLKICRTYGEGGHQQGQSMEWKSFPTLTEKVISDHHSCAVGKENYRAIKSEGER